MGRKVNKLKNRIAELKRERRQAAINHCQELAILRVQLQQRAALTIDIREDRSFGPRQVFALMVHLDPECFERDFYRQRIVDVRSYALTVAGDVANKVESALFDWIGKQKMAISSRHLTTTSGR